ncbi:uncharacterized protein LOC121413239 [Lytechinus variegatus]|uniref:uncharacterized protein LOC121413239 n=1 Tax=Lytechinus variegatus TaxID=7654 RepID=UPI001BB166B3|nr:uncharacterized protein LOC121413239 [Lytechinus variegatus]
MEEPEGTEQAGQPADGQSNTSEMLKYLNMQKPGSDQVQRLPKLLGEPSEAIKVFEEYNRIVFSDEIQSMFNDKLDFTKPDVLSEMQNVWRRASCLTLERCGLDQFKPLFAPGKIQSMHRLMMAAYGDCPEVVKMLSYMSEPATPLPLPSALEVGDEMPANLQLVSLHGKLMKLSDLHINKDRPMMILASSAS